jgi:aryl sulfotransferase
MATNVTPPCQVIQTRMSDTQRWDHVKLRADDIIVASWGKTGTTLTQQMVYQLVTGGSDDVAAIEASPWIERRAGGPVEIIAAMLEAQTHRRVMKTHAPFEATPFLETIKYVYIGRDARDVAWSLHNHMLLELEQLKALGPEQLKALGVAEQDLHLPSAREFYLHWLKAPDEAHGQEPLFWVNVQSWWNQRHRPNVLLLHYAHLIANLSGEMRRLSAFLDIPIDEARLPWLIERCGLDYMRARAAGSRFPPGFFNKGTNGRWQSVLSPEEVALCDQMAAKKVTADCAHWIKTGALSG